VEAPAHGDDGSAGELAEQQTAGVRLDRRQREFGDVLVGNLGVDADPLRQRAEARPEDEGVRRFRARPGADRLHRFIECVPEAVGRQRRSPNIDENRS
jgi:hypothetical protein